MSSDRERSDRDKKKVLKQFWSFKDYEYFAQLQLPNPQDLDRLKKDLSELVDRPSDPKVRLLSVTRLLFLTGFDSPESSS